MIGWLIGLVVCVLIAVWLAPHIPPPGNSIVRVGAWIMAIVFLILLIAGLVNGATAGLSGWPGLYLDD